MLRTVVSIVLIGLVLFFGFMFVRRWAEDGFAEAKAWAVGFFATVVGTVADWWEYVFG